MSNRSTLLRLHVNDNVLVALGLVVPGDTQLDNGVALTVVEQVTLGHKVASREIAAGETITKYGMPIGVAIQDIARGAHVHVHNIASRYTETHYLSEEAGLNDG